MSVGLAALRRPQLAFGGKLKAGRASRAEGLPPFEESPGDC